MAMYERLPPGEHKLADTVLARLNNLASYSATELAADARVSKATAARFFRRIGYDELRAQWSDHRNYWGCLRTQSAELDKLIEQFNAEVLAR